MTAVAAELWREQGGARLLSRQNKAIGGRFLYEVVRGTPVCDSEPQPCNWFVGGCENGQRTARQGVIPHMAAREKSWRGNVGNTWTDHFLW